MCYSSEIFDSNWQAFVFTLMEDDIFKTPCPGGRSEALQICQRNTTPTSHAGYKKRELKENQNTNKVERR